MKQSFSDTFSCRYLAACVVCAAGLLSAQPATRHQAQLTGGIAVGELSLDDTTSYRSTEGVINGYYFGDFTLLPWLELFVQERLDNMIHLGEPADEIDGITSASQLRVLAAKNIQSSNDISLGARLVSKVNAVLSQRYFFILKDLGLDAQPQEPFYFTASDPGGFGKLTLIRNYKAFSRLGVETGNGPVAFTGDAYLVNHSYAIKSYGYSSISEKIDSLAGSESARDLDMLYRIHIEKSLPAGLSAGAYSFIKNSLSGKRYFDTYNARLFVQGTHKLPAQNTLTWYSGGRWFESKMMDHLDYGTGPGIDLYLRDVWLITTGLYLKATATMNADFRGMFKHRYEASLRYATRSESAIETGWFINAGGLFPLRGPYLRSNLRIGERLNCSLDSKLVYEGPDQQFATMTFLKFVVQPEIAVSITDGFETLLGAQYSKFNQDDLSGFPSHLLAHAGIRLALGHQP